MNWIYVAIGLLMLAAIIQVWDMVERGCFSSGSTKREPAVCPCADPECPDP